MNKKRIEEQEIKVQEVIVELELESSVIPSGWLVSWSDEKRKLHVQIQNYSYSSWYLFQEVKKL